MTRFFTILGLVGTSSLLLATSSAKADGDATNGASAQALFDLGKKLMAKKNYAEACPKLAESQRLDPATGTLLNLADCYERAGKQVSAWSAYLDAAASARAAGQTDREHLARERAAALAPKLSKLVINVDPKNADMEGFQVQRDGAVVGAPQWGVPVPAELGDHKLEASAPGSEPWEMTITVPNNAQTVTATVPALEALPVPPPPPLAQKPPPEKPPADTHADSWSPRKTAAIVAGGIGVVGVALGATFGFMAKSTYKKSEPYCNGDHCDPPGHDYRESAFNKATVANVAFAAGAAGLIGGAVLWLTAPKPSQGEHAQLPLLAPAIGPKAGFLSIQRNW